jgi:putative transposase
MIRTYKYRLSPTKKQQHLLSALFFQMQTVYNDALNHRRWAWRQSRRSINYYDQWRRMRDERRKLPDEMGMLNATSIQQMLRRVDKAYKAFYRRAGRGEKGGHPRFKGRNRFKSIEYRYSDGCKLSGSSLYIQHIGNVRVKLHRPIPADATIKQMVIKRTAGHWYVSFQLEMPDPTPSQHDGPAVGIDVGLHSLLALSNGTLIDNPRWLRQGLGKLRTTQRRLSRRKKFGSGWRKAARQVAKLQEHVANQRRDFWHKTTSELAKTYSLIAVEDLNLSFMTRNGNLSLSAHDASLGMFRQMLGYKVENTGSQVIGVNPRNTSQACSGCGIIVAKGLNVRVHHCSACGIILDRDINAALNILALGLSVKALTYPDGDCVALEAPSIYRGE